MSTGTIDPSSPALSDQTRLWLKDRQMQRRVPASQAWRGCLGLAITLSDVNATEYVGQHALIPNQNVTWMAIRDIPRGHFHGYPRLNRRTVSYVSSTRAVLRFGMPCIDFSSDREGWDLRDCPTSNPHSLRHFAQATSASDHADPVRELAVINKLSTNMTEFAFYANHHPGRPYRCPWAGHAPAGSKRFVPRPATEWMPRAYLAYPEHQIAELFRRLGREGKNETRGSESPLLLPSLPAKSFFDSISHGLPLHASGPCTYLGTRSADRGWAEDPRLTCHAFRFGTDQKVRQVYLPAGVRVSVRLGQRLEGGEVWCRLLPTAPRSWSDQTAEGKWANLSHICRGEWCALLFQYLWLCDKGLRLECCPNRLLFRADLVAFAARQVRPEGLWWDLRPCAEMVDGLLEAATFPPLPLSRWDELRRELPGSVALNAFGCGIRVVQGDHKKVQLNGGIYGRDVVAKEPACAFKQAG